MKLNFKEFRLRTVLIHSIWLTVLGVILFRLGTANNQQLPYKEFFAIAGILLATTPWIVQLLVSTVIILTYNAGVCDLTWLIKPSAIDSSRGMNTDMNLSVLRWNRVRNGFIIDIPNSPKLQRSRTI